METSCSWNSCSFCKRAFQFVFSDLIFQLVGLCNQERDLVHVDKNTSFPFLLQLRLNPQSPTGFIILTLEFVS